MFDMATTTPPADVFVCEPIKPAGVFDASRMARGEPGLPTAFEWRDDTYRVAQVLESWKSTGPCTHGSGEVYLRKHWYRVLVDDGSSWVIYFDRKARSRAQAHVRWHLYTRRGGAEA